MEHHSFSYLLTIKTICQNLVFYTQVTSSMKLDPSPHTIQSSIQKPTPYSAACHNASTNAHNANRAHRTQRIHKHHPRTSLLIDREQSAQRSDDYIISMQQKYAKTTTLYYPLNLSMFDDQASSANNLFPSNLRTHPVNQSANNSSKCIKRKIRQLPCAQAQEQLKHLNRER